MMNKIACLCLFVSIVVYAQTDGVPSGLSPTTLLPYGLAPGLITSIPHDKCGSVLAAQGEDLEIFALGVDRAIWHKRRTGATWAPWSSLGGVASSGPSVVKDDEGRLHLFIRGVDRSIWHAHQMSHGDSFAKWSNWARLGNFATTTGATAIVSAEGLIDVFALGADKAVWHIGQIGLHEADHTTTVGKCPTNTKEISSSESSFLECMADGDQVEKPQQGQGEQAQIEGQAKEEKSEKQQQAAVAPKKEKKNKVIWSEWESLGGIWTNKVSATISPDGLLSVFVRGIDRSLYQKFQVSTDNKGIQWSEWHNLRGVFASAPKVSAVQNSEGLTHVFARGIDRQYYVRSQQDTKGDGVVWKGWESLGGLWAGGPVIVPNSNDHLELFGRGTDLSIWHKTAEKSIDNDCKWGRPESLGGRFSAAPSVVVNADGFMEVFARGFDHSIWHKKQHESNETIIWSPWSSLGGSIKPFPC